MNSNGNHLNIETNNVPVDPSLSDIGDLTDSELVSSLLFSLTLQPLMNEEEGIHTEFLETNTTNEEQQVMTSSSKVNGVDHKHGETF